MIPLSYLLQPVVFEEISLYEFENLYREIAPEIAIDSEDEETGFIVTDFLKVLNTTKLVDTSDDLVLVLRIESEPHTDIRANSRFFKNSKLFFK